MVAVGVVVVALIPVPVRADDDPAMSSARVAQWASAFRRAVELKMETRLGPSTLQTLLDTRVWETVASSAPGIFASMVGGTRARLANEIQIVLNLKLKLMVRRCGLASWVDVGGGTCTHGWLLPDPAP